MFPERFNRSLSFRKAGTVFTAMTPQCNAHTTKWKLYTEICCNLQLDGLVDKCISYVVSFKFKNAVSEQSHKCQLHLLHPSIKHRPDKVVEKRMVQNFQRWEDCTYQRKLRHLISNFIDFLCVRIELTILPRLRF